ncbi:hypothetical protein SLE2022_248000 [Rubroshorea leprosula]
MRSSKPLNLLLLVLTILVIGLPCFIVATTKEWMPPELTKWRVEIVNGLRNNAALFVHCKSKENDLGIHNLTAGRNFTWSFRENFFHRTLFWCYLRKGDAHANFNVFWHDVLLFYKCGWKSCVWTAKDDGIYLKDFIKDSEELCEKWKPGS